MRVALTELRCARFRLHFHLRMDKATLRAFKKGIDQDFFTSQCKRLSTSRYVLRIRFPNNPDVFAADFLAEAKGDVKYLNFVWMRQSFALIQHFVSKARSLGCRRFLAFSDIAFVFPKTQRFLNFPHFPFMLRHEISAHGLGSTQLAFVGITFRKSKLGLSRVVLGSRDETQAIELITNLQLVDKTRIAEKVYSKARDIARLFLA